MNNVKEFFKNSKNKSLTMLGFYLIFFIFVFIFLNTGNSSNEQDFNIETSKTAIENYETINNYQYSILINNIDTIEGTYYDNKSLFNFNNMKYYYEDDTYIINDNTYSLVIFQYNIHRLFNNNLSTLFKELEKVSKTEFNDGTIKTSYTLDSNIFYKYYYDVDSIYNNKINIDITEKDNLVTNIYLDLNNLNIDIKTINIAYSNIDNIKSLDFNKDNYMLI